MIMTIHQKFHEQLVAHGLWPGQADAVLAALKAEPNSEPMEGRWDEPVENYPPQLMAVLWLSTKMAAVAWIDKNKPKHFARAMLDT